MSNGPVKGLVERTSSTTPALARSGAAQQSRLVKLGRSKRLVKPGWSNRLVKTGWSKRLVKTGWSKPGLSVHAEPGAVGRGRGLPRTPPPPRAQTRSHRHVHADTFTHTMVGGSGECVCGYGIFVVLTQSDFLSCIKLTHVKFKTYRR